MGNNMEIYARVASVPKEAQKPIRAGRLSGKTDINPMWRIMMLTDIFGPVGFGWKYVITNKRIEDGADGVKCAFVDIDLYVKFEGKWSEAIPGTGGSSFVAKEKSGPYTSDECFKMALTDSLSVSCKALGFGADVYWEGGRTKYTAAATENDESVQKQGTVATAQKQPAAITAREKLIRTLHAKGIDVASYGAEKGLTHKTTEETYLKLIKELEAG